MNKMSRFLLLLGGLLTSLSMFFACHLGGATDEEETFTFPTLKDSIGTADSVRIVLKDQGGRVVDTLFNDKVTASTQFADLKASHYNGGKVFIFIEATQNGKIVYKVERGFDPAQGGNLEGTKVVHVSPSSSVRFDWPSPKLTEGESAQFPNLKFTPPELADKRVAFISQNPSILAVDSTSLRAVKAGNATLVVCLQSDTTRCDNLVVAVAAKPESKIPDSLFLSPDPLELPLGGTDRLVVRVIPVSASSEVQWILVSGASIRVDADGTLNALSEGSSKVAAISKLNDKISDTATVTVLPISTPNRPKVEGPTLPTNNPTPKWTWTSGGNGGNGTYRYRLDNQDLSNTPASTDTSFVAPTNLSEGTHTLFVQERNAAGNWSQSGTWPVVIDTTAPKAPTVTVLQTSPTREMRPTWNWTGAPGDAHRFYRYKLNNDDLRSGAKDTTGTSFRPLGDLSNGTHVLYVQERDSAGNWSASGSAPIVIDTARPAAPTVSGPALTNDSTPTWTWATSTPGTVTFRYRLDNADLSTGAITTTLKELTPTTNLTEGAHTLYVQEGDAAGNWSPNGSREIRIDFTPPSPPKVSSSLHTTNLRPEWKWSGDNGNRIFRYKLDDSNMLSGATSTTDSTYAPSGDLKSGIHHTLYVQHMDSAGNWSNSASSKIRVHSQTGFATGFYTNDPFDRVVVGTRNGGTVWDTVSVSEGSALLATHFTDSKTGYVVGAGGQIQKTVDGGLSWSPQTSGTTQALTSVYFTDSSTGFITGDGGAVLKTTNAGESWSFQASVTADALLSIYFASKTIGYAVGAGGTIIKTTNGGSSWSPLPSFTSSHLKSVYFINADTGHAVGLSGAIARTVDGGKSWVVPEVAPTSNSLYSVYLADYLIGFAAGGSGTIIKTTDGGKTWNSQSSGTDEWIQSIFFLDGNQGIAVGRRGLVLRTLNGGLSWSPQFNQVDKDLNSVFFP